MNSQYENSIFFSNEEIERAKKARNLYAMLGYPSIYGFKIMVKNNMLMKSPINEKDIDITEKVFGPDIQSLKEKRSPKNKLASEFVFYIFAVLLHLLILSQQSKLYRRSGFLVIKISYRISISLDLYPLL